MFERLRFTRYALRFERAFKTDVWGPVKECFHPDAVYSIIDGTPYSGDTRGPDEISKLFQRMLNEIDRKFDKRKPKLAGWPTVNNGVLRVPWSATYTLGDNSVVLTGVSECRFSNGKIIELRDSGDAAQWDRLQALLGGASARA